jgi:hypothetical protein
MSQSILVFDFGTNEDAAQQARRKVETWTQSFRLGKKILLRFDREESPATPHGADGEPAKHGSGEAESSKKKSRSATGKAHSKAETTEKPEANPGVRLLVRLDFSDHEKLSHHRWLDRIRAEEPFKSAKGETIRPGDAAFAKTAELFDSLD